MKFRKQTKKILWIVFIMFPLGLISLPFYIPSMLLEPINIWATKKLDSFSKK